MRAELIDRLDPDDVARLAPDGSLRRDDPVQAGITDLVIPIRDARGYARAALTVPYVATSFSEVGVEQVLAAAIRTGAAIGDRIRGGSAAGGR